jgi:hypothetical protein
MHVGHERYSSVACRSLRRYCGAMPKASQKLAKEALRFVKGKKT